MMSTKKKPTKFRTKDLNLYQEVGSKNYTISNAKAMANSTPRGCTQILTESDLQSDAIETSVSHIFLPHKFRETVLH